MTAAPAVPGRRAPGARPAQFTPDLSAHERARGGRRRRLGSDHADPRFGPALAEDQERDVPARRRGSDTLTAVQIATRRRLTPDDVVNVALSRARQEDHGAESQKDELSDHKKDQPLAFHGDLTEFALCTFTDLSRFVSLTAANH